MSWQKYAAPLILEVKPSRKVCGFALATLLATLALILFLPLSWYINLALFSAVGAYGVFEWRRLTGDTRSGRIVQIVWDDGDAWWLHSADGREVAATLLPATYIQTFVIILQLRRADTGRRFGHILLDDNCDVETLRRLRVRLRHAG